MSEYLPQELVLQILSWLPPKSVLKFRCVSKLWCSLITNRNFTALHSQNYQTTLTAANNNPRLLVRTYSPLKNKELYSLHFDNDSFDLDFEAKIKYPFGGLSKFYLRIVGCCNGLLCLSNDLSECANTIVLWNPAIRRKLLLPVPGFMIEDYEWLEKWVVLGFGFDDRGNDYKVVRIGYCKSDNVAVVVEIYAVRDRAWRRIGGHCSRCRVVEFYWVQAFVKGAVHWVAYRLSEGRGRKLECLVLCFDMHDEVFNEMLVPEELVHKSPVCVFTAKVGDSLALFECDRRICSQLYSLWVMEEYGVVESWSKLFNVDIGCSPVGMPLGVRNDLQILVASAADGELVSYDPKIQRSVKLGIAGTRYSFYVDVYEESLALFLEGEKVSSWLELSSESDSSEDEEEEEEEEGYETLGVETTERLLHSTMSQYLYVFFTKH